METLTVKLDFSGDTTLYHQLYRFLAEEIGAGRIADGERLPSKRSLCAHLGVSQSTVETAYSLLQAEGYIRSVPKSGYFACGVQPVLPPAVLPQPAALEEGEEAAQEGDAQYEFSTGAIDTSTFPYASWAKITKEAVYQSPQLLQRGHRQGDLPFRLQLAEFLREYRGVSCNARQIVVGAGMEYLLAMLLRLLPADTLFALEDPGYGTTWRTVLTGGGRTVSVPVTAQGIDLQALARSGAQAVYVTPSHQFPTGVTMPIGSRWQLLQWASQQEGRYIIEDDYDSEFRYAARTIPAMQGLDEHGRVIYMGTFSRTIAPSIRAAYMVLPEGLLEVYQQRMTHSSCTVSRLEQETIRRFIARGLYARHLRRCGNLYRQKQALLTRRLQELPGAVVSGQQAGLHLLVTLPSRDEQWLAQRAAEYGVAVRPLGQYSHGTAYAPSTVVLGFAGLSLDEIEKACDLLRQAWGSKDTL